MKVTSVQPLNEKFEECDITTVTQNFYVKAGDAWLLIHNSPALVAGWRDGEFMLTDKAGFSAKGYDGLTTSQQDLERMILNRKIKLDTPEAKTARQSYAHKIASLYPLLKQVVPHNLKGYVQGDLLWTETPAIKQGSYVFKPNKIEYKVPVNSDLGAQIGKSKVGIVFHSKLASPADDEPDALRDPAQLGIRSTPDVVVVPHEMHFTKSFQLNMTTRKKIQQLVQNHGAQIDEFLDAVELANRQIKSLPMVMKSFLAHKAGEGDVHLKNAASEFIAYLDMPKSKVTAKAKENMLAWIKQHVTAFNVIWQIVDLIMQLKLALKAQMDDQVGDKVQAHLADQPGHEGFVSVTDAGTIKLVNRAQFMKKDAPLTEAHDSAHTSHTPRRVVFTFGRMNPPTSGHRMLVDKVKQEAGNDDYWVFLSHSQDAKKNPLTWSQKVHFVKKIMKPHAAHVVTVDSIKTPLQAANWLYDQGYTHMTLVVGSDRVSAMTDLMNGWNSEEIRRKDNRMPVDIQVVSAGDRDPDAEGIAGISGTKARQAVKQNDLDAFQSATGVQGDLTQELFQAVHKAMQPAPKLIQEAEHPGCIVSLKMSANSARRLHAWCKQHNVSVMDADLFHVTVISTYEYMPELFELHDSPVHVIAHPIKWKQLGAKALTLQLQSAHIMHMHERLADQGVQHKYANYIPHVSVNYQTLPGQKLPTQVPDFDVIFDVIDAGENDPNFAAKSVSR